MSYNWTNNNNNNTIKNNIMVMGPSTLKQMNQTTQKNI